MSKLDKKVAVITGGNSGIGYTTAKEFIQNGATVIITGRDEAKVKTAAKELGATGIVADVSDLNAIDNLVSKVKEEFGGVDVLFVNAGVYKGAAIGDNSEKLFDNMMDINFKGAVFTIEKFLNILNDSASIINLSSITAHIGMQNSSIYGASKAALDSYTRTASVELASRKIRVNSVNPGPVQTPIMQKTGVSDEKLEALANIMIERIPLKRIAQPQEIAKLVLFLASDDSSFITGNTINIDGGSSTNPLFN